MANTVLIVLSMSIGFFFILIGTLKITPALSDEVYREMRKIFIRHAKVFPLAKAMGFKINPHILRKVVGTTEVVAGAVLAIIPGPLKEVANIILLIILCGAVYGHVAIGDAMDKMTPALVSSAFELQLKLRSLVFGLLLICRFIVNLQVTAREKRQRAAAAAAEEKKTN